MELSAQERALLEQLELLIRQGRSEAEAAATLGVILPGQDELLARVVAFRHEIAEQRRTMAWNNAIFDPEDDGGPWYGGPTSMDVFWPQLKANLEADPSWVAAVPSLDEASTDIVGLLADPHSPTIRTRGLVLGFVQSGKTANFTATIAKAADSGYRLFIVLSGVHNSLRRQTQLRIDEQLVDEFPTRWVGLTDEHRDFGKPVKALPLLASPDLRLIAVVKKNVSRLTNLRDWLREAQKHGGLDSVPDHDHRRRGRSGQPQRGQGPGAGPDEDQPADHRAARAAEGGVRRLHRDALRERPGKPRRRQRHLPAVVHVLAAQAGNLLRFAGALRTTGLRGRRGRHGRGPRHDPHRADGEAERHATKRLLAEGVEVTHELGRAVTWFVLATTARRVRSGVAKHSSMLIHTTMRVAPQLGVHRSDPSLRQAAGRRCRRRPYRRRSRRMWDEEIAKEPAQRHGLAPVTFDELEAELLGHDR